MLKQMAAKPLKDIEMQQRSQASAGDYLRSASCVTAGGDPAERAVHLLNSRDLTGFADLLSEETPGKVRLDENHWINVAVHGGQGETLLIRAIKEKQLDFVEILLRSGADANLFSQELGVCPLHVAVESGDKKMVELLLGFENTRNRSKVNCQTKSGRTPLHTAVDKGDVEMVDMLLKQADIDVNVTERKGWQTPLYLAVKNRSAQLMEMLLEAGASADAVCYGRSIRQHAAQLLPEFRVDSVTCKRAPLVKQSSQTGLERMVQIIEKAILRRGSQADIQEFNDLALQMETKVLNSHQSGGLTLLQKCCVGTRQSRNLAELAQVLLREGVDSNFCPRDSQLPPVLLAAYRGQRAVLEVLHQHGADFSVTRSDTGESVLHRVLLKDEEAADTDDLAETVNYLLDAKNEPLATQIDKVLNKKDIIGNTPLHYATQKWDQFTVRTLLDRGANIGIKNKWGEVPINRILPSTMEEFLNTTCLNNNGKDVNHEDFQLTFKYNFLAPPIENLPPEIQGPYIEEAENLSPKHGHSRRHALPETESLWHMGQSKEHRHLLKHPVITSFLWYKWSRIRRYFNRNLRFYLLFVIILTWHVFEEYGGNDLRNSNGRILFWYGFFIVFSVGMLFFIIMDWVTDLSDTVYQQRITNAKGSQSKSRACFAVFLSTWVEAGYLACLGLVIWLGASCLYPVLTGLVVGLGLRELFQMAVSVRRYILDLENWIEMLMLTLIIAMLSLEDAGNLDLKRHLAAISLFLSWTELITFVAKHPRLTRYNVYVTMFYKVLWTFFFFLLWYLFFIVAFGLGFYIILHKDTIQVPKSMNGQAGNENITETGEPVSTEAKDEDEYVFFNNPWLALVKTSTMFVGELEFSDIPVNLESEMVPVSYLFFLTFVFLIVVVLMNLLNGLAVSDTGSIQDKSETVAYLSRVETISYAESLLLGDPFDFLASWPRLDFWTGLPSLSCFRQFYRNSTLRNWFQRLTGATDILLFYNFLPDKELVVKPNRSPDNCLDIEPLPKEILDAARTIVLAQSEPRMEECNWKQILGRLNKIEDTLAVLLNHLQVEAKK